MKDQARKLPGLAIGCAFAAALGMAATNQTVSAGDKEKCYGVSKAGKNDCGALDGSHPCGGMSSKDHDPNEWVYVPKGTCEKIGGVVKGEKPAK